MSSERIAIIGAGISGLSAAHYLKLKGYSNVVIFEANDRIGGKIRTVEKEGCLYEIGGVFVQESFSTIKELLAAYGETLSKKEGLKTVVWEDGRLCSNLKQHRKKFGLVKIIKDFYKLWRLLRKYDSLDSPAMVGSDAELYATFIKLSQRDQIESIPGMVAPFITGMGYGFVDRTPALYQLKLMKRAFGFAVALEINNQFGTNIPGTYFVKNGYQNLLEKMAKSFSVHLSSPVEKIERTSDAIKITVNGEIRSFDKVILATPPSNTVNFLDMDGEETAIFEKSQHYYFRSSFFTGKNLPRGKMVFFPESNKSDKLAYVNSLHNWHPQNDYFSAYQLHDDSISGEQLDQQLAKVVGDLGGSIEEMHIQESFNYFPHYLEEDLLKDKPYDRLEALQGKKGTYYIGAAVSAESADDAASYVKNLVERFF